MGSGVGVDITGWEGMGLGSCRLAGGTAGVAQEVNNNTPMIVHKTRFNFFLILILSNAFALTCVPSGEVFKRPFMAAFIPLTEFFLPGLLNNQTDTHRGYAGNPTIDPKFGLLRGLSG